MAPIRPFHIQVRRPTIVRAYHAPCSPRPRERGSAPGLSNMVVDAFDDSLLKSSTIEMTRLTGED